MFTKLSTFAILATTALAFPPPLSPILEPPSTVLQPIATETAADFSIGLSNGTQFFSDLTSNGASSGRGHARLVNRCSFDVVFQRCYQPHGGHLGGCNPSQNGVYHLPAGHTFTQQFTPVLRNGISFKVRHHDGNFQKSVLQLEYTHDVDANGPYVSYDVSEVDGNSFGKYGFTLTNSDPKCFHKKCHPPAKRCDGVFQFNKPESGTPHNCGIHSNIGLVICSDTNK